MPKKNAHGLYLRPDGVYEKIKTINGKRYPLRSTDPDEVWRQYYNLEQLPTQGPLFSDIVQEWYNHNEPAWRPGTTRTYKPATERIKDYFAGYRVCELEAPDIRNFLFWLKDKKFSEKSVKKYLSIVSMAFIYAITCDDHWRKDNPAQYVQIPSDLPKKKRRPPTDEQMRKVREGLSNPLGLLPAFFIYSGARLGEALGIQGKHIVGNTITIEQELTWPSNKPVIVPYVKTEAGERDIGVLDALMQMLPRNLKPDEFLFGGKQPWRKSTFDSNWVRWCRSVGLAHPKKHIDKNGKEITKWRADITPHQLRHEYASMCFEAGIDEKVASTMFGHSDPTTMRNIYQNIRSRQISDAIEKMNQLETERQTKA